MSSQQHIHQAVVALIRRGDEVLLVQQQEPYDPVPTWILPGGSVEERELLHEALAREVKEESGLTVLHPGRLAYTAQYDNRHKTHQLMVYVFEVQDWEGEINCNDPDGHVIQACFFPLEEALHKLEEDQLRDRSVPVLAYLRGECTVGSFWLYRRHIDGRYELVWRPDRLQAS